MADTITWTIAPGASISDFKDPAAVLGAPWTTDERRVALCLETAAALAVGTTQLQLVWSPNAGTTKRGVRTSAAGVVCAIAADPTPDDGLLIILTQDQVAAVFKLAGSVAIRALDAGNAAKAQAGGAVITGRPVHI
jgi:hypothetical protein